MATNAIVLEGSQGKEFNPERALTMVQTAVSEHGHVSLPAYVAGAEEIYKLIYNNGLFTASEGENMLSGVEIKLTLLRKLCGGESREHYRSVQSMMDYESQHQLVERQDTPSGTITLLRIHRMIEFVRAVLDTFISPTVTDHALPFEMSKAYTQTVGRFHPQLLMVSIQLALPLVTPSRDALKAAIGVKDSVQWMVSLSQGLKKCYDAVQKVYRDRNWLHLSQGSL